MKKHYRKENNCLNCGTTLQGKFCHNCGQENLEIKENFGHMMAHTISDYFHFDHQFFHTLKPLLFKPGYLTNEYTAGRRTQYLHPVKMYIFISLIYFILFFKTGHDVVKVKDTGATPPKSGQNTDSVKKAIAASRFIPEATKKEIRKDIDKDNAAEPKGLEDGDAHGPNKWFHPTTHDTSYVQYLANQQKLPAAQKDGVLIRLWNKKVYGYLERYGSLARETFVEEVQHNAPKMMFLLLPLFALILRVAFWKNKKFYVEHLIFSFHFHCFLFLFLTILMSLQVILPASWDPVMQWVMLFATLYILWYAHHALKVVYKRSWFRTTTKLIGMSTMYFMSFAFCITLLFLVTTII
ncbi:DUF3667 domain-containing protein [Mucilaginibacter ginsenosidivorans]|uniref:DUF3667 domain-containing protein n=1 Tax=Mucilaginibacter ginsenosidivorans TaxID=398053 RepID=A0A5B8V0L0_9SPHI|nr:DUF3667 domain-containing protein [Mucilaginibacter ginsenosidivorans]QEC64171.1 DUF3667 domain-containing protein [Mucilaginibacter ginsenosidivorans]